MERKDSWPAYSQHILQVVVNLESLQGRVLLDTQQHDMDYKLLLISMSISTLIPH